MQNLVDLYDSQPIGNWLIALGCNTVLVAIALVLPRKALTTAGILHAWFLGVTLWGCLGWQGYAIMFCYLVLGTGITYVGKDIKTAKGIAERREGARGPENLWGSALTGTVCAIGYALLPHPLWLLAYTASIATKLSDTTASEIGKAYGKTTYLITTLKPVPAGTEGAVSLEGTLAGMVGSIVIAAISLLVGILTHPLEIAWCAIAALVATNLESLIGATLQAKWAWLTNEVVNGINTAIGATVAVLLAISIASVVN
jgi:uncharacterized protein (TIGR00297 family)